MTDNLYDSVSHVLATALGFTSRRRDQCMRHYTWTKPAANAESPPIPDDVIINPCSEIPFDYTLYITFKGARLEVQTSSFWFDLNDPQLLDKLTVEFKDLTSLRKKISELRKSDVCFSRYGRRFNYNLVKLLSDNKAAARRSLGCKLPESTETG